MTDWNVHLIKLNKVGNHPNGDSLSITQVYGQPVIFRRGVLEAGDLAVFIPPDSVLPANPESPVIKDSGLPPLHCVEARRFRGIFSNGFLIPAKAVFSPTELETLQVGDHVAERLGITKHEDAGERLATSGENERDHKYMPLYTDIEGLPKNREVLKEGEEVVLTEKIHGAHSRYCFRDGRLWVGSRTQIKAQNVRLNGTEGNLWWAVAKEIKLEDKFKSLVKPDGREQQDKFQECGLPNHNLEGIVLFGEVYGKVQDLNYGVTSGGKFRLFDTYSPALGRYNDWDVTVAIAKYMDLPLVPELYRGPWSSELEEMRNGPSVLYPGHIREGYVVKPIKERHIEFNPDVRHSLSGRMILKHIGEAYKLRSKKKK